MNLSGSGPEIPFLVQFLLLLWSLGLKGLALWKSAKYDQRSWFIAILVLQTLGIVEIIYLFRFAKKRLEFSELAFWKKQK